MLNHQLSIKVKKLKYAVPKNAFKKAAVITVIGITVVLTGTFLMSLFEPNLEIKDIVFEIVSAYGTVGDLSLIHI